MTERCESRWAGHQCDKDAGHTGPHYAESKDPATNTYLTQYGIGWPNLGGDR